MKKHRVILILGLVAWVSIFCHATETNNPVQGLRVATCAHSFHAFVPKILTDIAESADIQGHIQVGTSVIGGSRVIDRGDVPDEKLCNEEPEMRCQECSVMSPLTAFFL